MAQLDHFPTSADKPFWVYYSSGGYLTTPELYFYGMIGDTVIGENTYSKVYSSDTDTIFNEVSSATKYIGAMRAIDNKVFMVYSDNYEEFLLYDFAVNENESFEYSNCGYGICTLEVKSIETIDICSYLHKKISITADNGIGHGWWIENIGGYNGLDISLAFDTDNNPPATQLVCFKYNNNNYYPNSDGSCLSKYLVKTTINDVSSISCFSITPNPVHSTLYLTLPQGEHTIAIYNAAGSPVLKQQAAEPQAQIGVNGLPAGVYFVQVDGGEMLKFVKE